MNRDETYQDVCVNPNRHPGLSNQPSNRPPREGSIVASHISDLLELRPSYWTHELENAPSILMRMAVGVSLKTSR